MDDVQLAWVAGFLEGEGSFMVKTGACARISCASIDRDVLDRLQALAGGNINKVTSREPHHQQAWIWGLNGKPAEELMLRVRPLMGLRRARKIADVLEQVEAFRAAKADKKARWQVRVDEAVDEYLAGGTTLRAMAKKYRLSHVTIMRGAAARG